MKFHPVDLNYEYPADNSSALFQQCGIVPAHYPFTRLTWIQPFSKPKILANSVPVVNVPLLHESLERLEISRTKSFPPTTNLPPFHRKCRSFSLSNSPAIHHCSFEFLPPPPPRETSRHRLVMQSREAHLLRAGQFFFFSSKVNTRQPLSVIIFRYSSFEFRFECIYWFRLWEK